MTLIFHKRKPFLPFAVAIGTLLLFSSINAQTIHYRNEIDIPGESFSWMSHITTLDGGSLMITTTSNNITSDNCVTLIKMNPAGSVTWHKRFGPALLESYNVIQTPDSGYFFIGTDYTTSAKGVYVRLDKFGNVIFSRFYSPPSQYQLSTMVQPLAKNDGGFYIASNLSNTLAGGYFWHLLEIDATGSIVLSNVYTGTQGKSYCTAIDTAVNGDIFMMGYGIDPQSGYHHPVIMRLDPPGSIIWYNGYKATGYDVLAWAYDKGPGDNIYASASLYDFPIMQYSIFLMKVDPNGNELWAMRYPTSTYNFPYALKVVEGSNLVMAGELYTLKTDSSGVPICARTHLNALTTSLDTLTGPVYAYCGFSYSSNRAVFFTSGICGETCNDSTFNVTKIAVPVYDSALNGQSPMPLIDSSYNLPTAFATVHTIEICTTVGIDEPETSHVLIYPSPATSILYIEAASEITQVELFCPDGRMVKSEKGSSLSWTLDVNNLPNGIYILRTGTYTGIFNHPVVIHH